MELFYEALCASEILHCTVSHRPLKALVIILLDHFVPANETCFKNVPFLRMPPFFHFGVFDYLLNIQTTNKCINLPTSFAFRWQTQSLTQVKNTIKRKLVKAAG